ncbi:MAG: diguanylate cyclase [Panacagrimonas sp.]|nr:GGDEF domain-containing protein [Panacagrimonas sp.]MCC2659019.1 diguanylate cyclase [Panacagrimonas sp.]
MSAPYTEKASEHLSVISVDQKDPLYSAFGFDRKLLPIVRRAVRLLTYSTNVSEAAVVDFDVTGSPRFLARHGGVGPLAPNVLQHCVRTLESRAGWVHRTVVGRSNGRPAFFAGLPLIIEGDTATGVICVFDDRPRPWEQSAQLSLRDIRELVECELQSRRDATRDPLTGLYNRRLFDDVLQREWRRALREGNPISLLSLDLDHFKAFNDCYGHPRGDQALRSVAACFQQTARRPGDTVGRVGGEEFLVCLPATDAEGVSTAAAALVGAVARLNIPHAKSPQHKLTVSIGGVTAWPTEDHDPGLEALRQAADDALYQAKAQGRNRACIGPALGAMADHGWALEPGSMSFRGRVRTEAPRIR